MELEALESQLADLVPQQLADAPGLRSIPVYDWQHVAIVPPAHALAKLQTTPGKLTLKDLARNPIVTYDAHFAGRSRIDAAFAEAGIEPSIVLEAIDADVIKTYVRLGLGVGIVAELAVRDDPPGGELVSRPLGHLFVRNVARLAFKRGAYLRNFVLSFAEMLSDRLTRALIARAMAGQTDGDPEYQL